MQWVLVRTLKTSLLRGRIFVGLCSTRQAGARFLFLSCDKTNDSRSRWHALRESQEECPNHATWTSWENVWVGVAANAGNPSQPKSPYSDLLDKSIFPKATKFLGIMVYNSGLLLPNPIECMLAQVDVGMFQLGIWCQSEIIEMVAAIEDSSNLRFKFDSSVWLSIRYNRTLCMTGEKRKLLLTRMLISIVNFVGIKGENQTTERLLNEVQGFHFVLCQNAKGGCYLVYPEVAVEKDMLLSGVLHRACLSMQQSLAGKLSFAIAGDTNSAPQRRSAIFRILCLTPLDWSFITSGTLKVRSR